MRARTAAVGAAILALATALPSAAPQQAGGQQPRARIEHAAADQEPAAPSLAEPEVADLSPDDATFDNRDDVDLTPLVGQSRRLGQSGPSLEAVLQRAYKPIRRSEFFSSGFLTEDLPLPYGRILGTVTPLQIEEVSSRSTALLYGRVAVAPPFGGKYLVGDTLMAVIVGREIHELAEVERLE